MSQRVVTSVSSRFLQSRTVFDRCRRITVCRAHLATTLQTPSLRRFASSVDPSSNSHNRRISQISAEVVGDCVSENSSITGSSSSSSSTCGSEDGKRKSRGFLDRHWSGFCDSWNEVLGRRPLAMVVFFNASCTLTWAIIFGSLSCTPMARAALAAPDFAVGWLVMRTTVKLRQPLNIALAAILSNLVPDLSKLKVSPLLAVVTADKDAQKAFDSARRDFFRSRHLGRRGRRLVRRFFQRSSSFVRWAEGPIDKYGLAYFFTSKATSVSALCGATVAAMHGLDITGTLTSWGFSSDLQADAGLFACAAALNVPMAPLHFLGAVWAVRHIEMQAGRAWQFQVRWEEEQAKLRQAETPQSPRPATESEASASYADVVAGPLPSSRDGKETPRLSFEEQLQRAGELGFGHGSASLKIKDSEILKDDVRHLPESRGVDRLTNSKTVDKAAAASPTRATTDDSQTVHSNTVTNTTAAPSTLPYHSSISESSTTAKLQPELSTETFQKTIQKEEIANEKREETLEKRQNSNSNGQSQTAPESEDPEASEMTEQEYVKNFVSAVAMVAVCLDLSVALCIMRRMAKAQVSGESDSESPKDEAETWFQKTSRQWNALFTHLSLQKSISETETAGVDLGKS